MLECFFSFPSLFFSSASLSSGSSSCSVGSNCKITSTSAWTYKQSYTKKSLTTVFFLFIYYYSSLQHIHFIFLHLLLVPLFPIIVMILNIQFHMIFHLILMIISHLLQINFHNLVQFLHQTSVYFTFSYIFKATSLNSTSKTIILSRGSTKATSISFTISLTYNNNQFTITSPTFNKVYFLFYFILFRHFL